jgi:hypothetical protein
LPVINRVAADYTDQIRFIAVAGRSNNFDKTSQRAKELFHRLDWGLDQSIWELYGVPFQPHTVLITGNDIVLDSYFGVGSEDELRAALDRLVATIGA